MKSRWTPQGRDYLGQDVTAEAAPRFFLQTLVGVFWFWSKGLEFSNGKAIFGEADESPGLFVADRDEVGAAFDFGSQGGSDAQSELNGPVGKCFPSFPLSSFFSFRGALPKVFPSALRGQIQSWGVFSPFPAQTRIFLGVGANPLLILLLLSWEQQNVFARIIPDLPTPPDSFLGYGVWEKAAPG